MWCKNIHLVLANFYKTLLWLCVYIQKLSSLYTTINFYHTTGCSCEHLVASFRNIPAFFNIHWELLTNHRSPYPNMMGMNTTPGEKSCMLWLSCHFLTCVIDARSSMSNAIMRSAIITTCSTITYNSLYYQSQMGKSSLFTAIERGHLEALRLLLKNGADPNKGYKVRVAEYCLIYV